MPPRANNCLLLYAGSGTTPVLIPSDPNGSIKMSTLITWFPNASTITEFKIDEGEKEALFKDLISKATKAMRVDDENDKRIIRVPSGWQTNIFMPVYPSLPLSSTTGVVGAKRRRMDEEEFSEEDRKHYWDLYKHYLLYAEVDGTKVAASLLDDNHVVLCLHEVPELDKLREELMTLSGEIDEFVKSAYNEDDGGLSEGFLSKMKESLNGKDDELKKAASKVRMRFTNCDGAAFMTKITYHSWEHDICIMESLRPIYVNTPSVESCGMRTKYIALGFCGASNCILRGIIAGSTRDRYFGAPGGFPGMSGGPVVERFENGKGRLIGVCAGTPYDIINEHSSFLDATTALKCSQTNVACIEIIPSLHFCFGGLSASRPKKRSKLVEALKSLNLLKPTSETSSTNPPRVDSSTELNTSETSHNAT